MAIHPTTLIDGLKNPAAFPHSCQQIQVMETHISWVVLTGQRAYKIKKPVNLGFVDFTTLTQRRHFCEEELRLNRRLAPDLYLDVVPITGTLQNPQVDGDGPAIDYAVRMLQFDQPNLLSNLSRSELQHHHIDDLADRCGQFHLAATVADAGSEFGTPDGIMTSVRENFDVLCAAEDPIAEMASGLRRLAEQQFQLLKPVFEQRRQNGMVRECHGDMHLGNMFLQRDHVVVFDGIEFNEGFRWIDIINDMAFAVMDFEDRNLNDLARRFLNRWLENTGDYAGLRVLPFYAAYRAAVRAKIDAIRLNQPEVSSSEQRHLSKDCLGYLEQARHHTAVRQPWLLITTGPSGSGKTTVTQGLIEATETIRIRSDVERKRLFGLRPEESSDSGTKHRMYSPETTTAVYDHLATLATQVITAGFPVVVDATFLKQAERERFAALAAELQVPYGIIRCDAEPDTLKQRIQSRRQQQADASEADATVLQQQLQTAEPLSSAELRSAIDGHVADLAAAVRQKLLPR
ncbi:MAG: AAA family ATPase [Fuerstiella sp.]